MLVMIDNYDSFTFNVVRYFRELEQDVQVFRNDAISVAQLRSLQPAGIILSPGPCTPDEAGVSLEVVRELAGVVPILGVCLGHQTIAQAFGARVVRAPQIMHGKTSALVHQQQGLFTGLPEQFEVARYHSLVVEPDSLPPEFAVDAWTVATAAEPSQIMALRHRELPLWGVQFHPEAVLTNYGHEVLANFIRQL